MKISGFSLIELLITVTIISLLASMGFSYYSQHIVNEKRKEAIAALQKLSIAMEQYYITHHSYKEASLSALDFPEKIANNRYQLIITSAKDNDYTLAAKPLAHQAQNDTSCATLILNASGEKMISGTGNIAKCWS